MGSYPLERNYKVNFEIEIKLEVGTRKSVELEKLIENLEERKLGTRKQKPKTPKLCIPNRNLLQRRQRKRVLSQKVAEIATLKLFKEAKNIYNHHTYITRKAEKVK